MKYDPDLRLHSLSRKGLGPALAPNIQILGGVSIDSDQNELVGNQENAAPIIVFVHGAGFATQAHLRDPFKTVYSLSLIHI